MVNFAGIVVRGDSPVQVPQQFANVQIGLPMYSGTHYLCLQMLEGFVPRDLVKIGRVPNGSNYRFKMLMDETIEATTLTEPYLSLAEKMGCRIVISAFHHGIDRACIGAIDLRRLAAYPGSLHDDLRLVQFAGTDWHCRPGRAAGCAPRPGCLHRADAICVCISDHRGSAVSRCAAALCVRAARVTRVRIRRLIEACDARRIHTEFPDLRAACARNAEE